MMPSAQMASTISSIHQSKSLYVIPPLILLWTAAATPPLCLSLPCCLLAGFP
jgi:hypothetical protein